MGPGMYVIAIMGCADGGSACTTVATLPTTYRSEAACSAASLRALEDGDRFDYPTIMAQCRAAAEKGMASRQQRARVTISGRSGS